VNLSDEDNAKKIKVKSAYVRWMPDDEEPKVRVLARQFGVNRNTITRWIKRGNWNKSRSNHWAKVGPLVDQKNASAQADEIARSILIFNTTDEINLELLQGAKSDIKNAMKIKDAAERALALSLIYQRPELQPFLGIGAVDKSARGKKFMRGEPDSRSEATIPPGEAAILKRALAILPDEDEEGKNEA